MFYGKGEIWDSKNKEIGKTGQLDLIIFRDDAPRLTFGGGRETVLVEGVFAVIEVKSNLDREKLEEAGKTLEKVRDLEIIRPQTQASMGISIDRPLRIIFAYKGATWNTLLDEIEKKLWYHLYDLICILERGVYIKEGGLLEWNNNNPYLIINGKAAALGYLYLYLTTYCQGFVSNRINLKPYFMPFNHWNS